MNEKHLSSLDYEKYLDGNDISEEYLMWLEPIADHLMQCDCCKQILNKVMQIEHIYDNGVLNISSVKAKEVTIRKILLVETLKQMYMNDKNVRMKHLVDKLKEMQMEPVRKRKSNIEKTYRGWYDAQIPSFNSSIQIPDWIKNISSQKSSSNVCMQQSIQGINRSCKLDENKRTTNVTDKTSIPLSKAYSIQSQNIKANVTQVSHEKGKLIVGVEASVYAKTVTVIIQKVTGEVDVKEAKLHRTLEKAEDKALWLAVFECDELSEYYDIYVDTE